MKVNVISDIHATVDNKLNVVYSCPKRSLKRILHTVDVLKDYWHANEAEIRKHKIVYSPLSEMCPETKVITCHDDMIRCIERYGKLAENEFAELDTNEKMFSMVRALTNIEDFFLLSKLNWHHKQDVLFFEDLRDYVFKCKYDFDPSKLEPADYLIIAGDLGIEPIYDLVLKDIEKKTEGKFKKILHIAGNHDHWWLRVNGLSEQKPDKPNFDRDYCLHADGDYAFIGCTLWTPVSDSQAWAVGRYMNDYRYTPGGFSPYMSRHQYEIQSAWLRQQLAKNSSKKCIVFTHHQPFDELTLDDYKHNGKGWDGVDVNAAYVVQDHSLDDIADSHNIVLWACGHTHQNYDGMLHGVHVVRNPIGYSDICGHCPPENMSGTWYNKIVEV